MKTQRLWLLGLVVSMALAVWMPGWAERAAIQLGQIYPQWHSDLPNVYPVTVETAWDDADSHKWIAEPWGDDIEVDHVAFAGRSILSAAVSPTGHDWALIRTDAFPTENWEGKTGLRADIYQAGGATGIDLKLEVRGPLFHPDLIESVYCYNLQRNAWNTCTWSFTAAENYGEVAHLSIVFDHLGGTGVTFYVDNLRLVGTPGEEAWDDMDDGSREWFYSGNWYNWNPNTPFGLEPISHGGSNPTTPAGSTYLRWDYDHGCCYPLTAAEVGTTQLDDRRDWRGYNRLTADIRVSDPGVPVGVFFWDAEGMTTPVDCRGFGTPARKVGAAGTWQTLTWDLPWPPCFDNTGIDEIKFVVNDVDEYQAGTLYLDNVSLVSDTLPSPVTGLAYVFEDFNDRDRSLNDFNGNWGELNGDHIATTFSTSTYRGTWGASLKVDYGLASASFAGVWQSLWGHSGYSQTQYLDLTDIYGALNEQDKGFEQIHFWVRGSGATTSTHNVKVELKDNMGDENRTAYRYIAIEDGDATWQRVVLDADVTNASFWSYNSLPPDPTRMKQMVFVVERAFNDPNGTFYVDDIRFVDADDSPFDPDQHTDDEFLDMVSQKAFLYFLDWYDPDAGLFQDRSTSPDRMSTASTGFGLTALTIGESRGWIERSLAIDMITRTLQTLYDGQSPTDTVPDTIAGTNGYKGFFYHFLGNDGLRRGDGSELSPVDTAILMAGVLTAREHFYDVQEIVHLADQIYERVEWDWMLDSSNDLFYLAWKPEQSPGYGIGAPGGGYFSSHHWDYYTDEVILINLLAIGSPTHRVPEQVFYAWQRDLDAYGERSLIRSYNGSLFTYVFARLWVDLAALGTDHHPSQPVDWWANSVEAARAHWQFALDHEDDTACDGDEDRTTYGEQSWGLTAAEGPDGDYHAYGALPAAISPEHDGTIAPYGAGMATMLLPEKAIPALKHYFADTDLWRYRFGYGDAYNLDPPGCDGLWVNHVAYGIDQGPMLIGIENYRSGLVWDTMRRSHAIRRALCLIGDCTYLPLVLRNYP
jgi:hypothetical protein